VYLNLEIKKLFSALDFFFPIITININIIIIIHKTSLPLPSKTARINLITHHTTSKPPQDIT